MKICVPSGGPSAIVVWVVRSRSMPNPPRRNATGLTISTDFSWNISVFFISFADSVARYIYLMAFINLQLTEHSATISGLAQMFVCPALLKTPSEIPLHEPIRPIVQQHRRQSPRTPSRAGQPTRPPRYASSNRERSPRDRWRAYARMRWVVNSSMANGAGDRSARNAWKRSSSRRASRR